MTRDKLLIQMQRYYHIKHVMVEGRYITPEQFMEEVLQLVEELGMVKTYDVDFSTPPNYDEETQGQQS